MSAAPRCEGQCSQYDECFGSIRRVRVYGNWIAEDDAVYFNYCNEAISIDRSRGFCVGILEDLE